MLDVIKISSKTDNIGFRIKPEDKAVIEKAAKKANRSIGDYCRIKLLEIANQELEKGGVAC